jgi:hypothetical protein
MFPLRSRAESPEQRSGDDHAQARSRRPDSGPTCASLATRKRVQAPRLLVTPRAPWCAASSLAFHRKSLWEAGSATLRAATLVKRQRILPSRADCCVVTASACTTKQRPSGCIRLAGGTGRTINVCTPRPAACGKAQRQHTCHQEQQVMPIGPQLLRSLPWKLVCA